MDFTAARDAITNHFSADLGFLNVAKEDVEGVAVYSVLKNNTTESKSSNLQWKVEKFSTFLPILENSEVFPHTRLELQCRATSQLEHRQPSSSPNGIAEWSGALHYRRKEQSSGKGKATYPYLQASFSGEVKKVFGIWEKGDQLIILRTKPRAAQQSHFIVLLTTTPLFDEKVLTAQSCWVTQSTAIPNNPTLVQAQAPFPVLPASDPRNLIFYGAPGTGKSYQIRSKVHLENTRTVVFHREFTNADFVGALKPLTRQDENSGDAIISYDFVPGPFLRILAAALANPSEQYWLVIEEINRANAASVFGELFLLLDRTPEGDSEYTVTLSDPIAQDWLARNGVLQCENIVLPRNLCIYASMNSSDQGVMPIDGAFKRRWNFVYVPIVFDEKAPKTSFDVVTEANAVLSVDWPTIAEAINGILSELSIPEDRHLGPFFLTASDQRDPERFLKEKLCLYLWDDVLRHGFRERIFESSSRTFGRLVTKIEQGHQVFSEELLGKLR